MHDFQVLRLRGRRPRRLPAAVLLQLHLARLPPVAQDARPAQETALPGYWVRNYDILQEIVLIYGLYLMVRACDHKHRVELVVMDWVGLTWT